MSKNAMFALTILFALLFCFVQNDSRVTAAVNTETPQKRTSNTCEFRSGPRKGQRQRYADQAALPIGTPCHDGQASRGVVVPEGEEESEGAGENEGRTSNTCEFRSGPRKGQRQRYPDQEALPIGTPCHDGHGSRGIVVPEGEEESEGAGEIEGRTSNTCEFRSGPRKGQRQRYPDQAALPIGTPCHDGQASRGVVVPEGEEESEGAGENEGRTSNTCEFRSGPRKGQRQRYPDQEALPIGTPCHDGHGSRGIVVPEGEDESERAGENQGRTSNTCFFLLGPRANKTQFFAGRRPALIGSACTDGASNRGIVVADRSRPLGQFSMARGQPSCKDIVQAEVPYKPNERIPKSGLATIDQQGPVIFLRTSQVRMFSPMVRGFLYAHECGHHALGQVRAFALFQLEIGPEGELAADCFAMTELRRLNMLEPSSVAEILNFLRGVPGDPTTYPGPLRVQRLRQCSS